MKNVLILGGGLGGLSAGLMLSRTGKFNVTVVEKEPKVGGVCGTFRYEDFLLDYGAHKVYSVIPGILDEFRALMSVDSIPHKKRNSIYLFGQYLNYPINMADLALKMGYKNLFQCGIGTLQSMIAKIGRKDKIESYEDFVVSKFGHKLYELVFEPLADKVWGNPKTLSADIAKTRIPSANIFDVLLKALGLKKEKTTTDAQFFYYPRSGFGALADKMAREISAKGGLVLTGTTAESFQMNGGGIHTAVLNSNGNEKIAETDLVISTLHPDQLLDIFPEYYAKNIKKARDLVGKLEYRSVILVYLFLDKDKVTDDHWIFFPGKDIIFSRIFEQKNMDNGMSPKGKTVLCCDFTDYERGPLYKQEDKVLADKCVGDLVKIGLIKPEWVQESLVRRFSKFYPRYGVGYKKTLKMIYDELQGVNNLLLSGRIGFYNYNNADHCLDMGRFIADSLLADKPVKVIWKELEDRVSEYRIVD